MLAAADDLDDLMLGLKLARRGDRGHGLFHRGGGILVDAAAGLADQEGYDLARAMAVQAGEIGVARGEAVHEALLHQEVQRTVDRDRREPAPARWRDTIGQIIGADRTMVGMQRLQRFAADRGQAQAALAADPLSALQRLACMTGVVMGVTADAVVMAVMTVFGVIVGVWLHFGRVALRRSIGQPAVTLGTMGILPACAEPKHFFPDCQEP